MNYIDQIVQEFKRLQYLNLLIKFKGNVTHAAKDLGIDRSNFLRTLRTLGIKAKAYRK